jgi:signal transduction histidine kinase
MIEPKINTPGDRQHLLSTSPPSRGQTQLAGCVVLALVVALLATVPFAHVPLANTEVLLPAYATAILINDLITSVLLFALYSVQRSRAVVVLAVGYLFTGLLVVPWALTFPGVFAPSGLLGAGLQTTASIAALRRIGFPLFVLAYAFLKDAEPDTPSAYGSTRPAIFSSVAAVVGAVCGLTWLFVASDELLPNFMADRMQTSALWLYVPGSAVLLYLVTLTVLWMRRHSVLDLWLMVVLCTLLIELALLSFLSSGRFSVGWWAGRFFGLASTSVVLFVLLAETTTLYARLVRSISAERRARETRLTTMEALSASIAHEVNQPLASMVTNADAGLRWLDRDVPNTGEARVALGRIVRDGHRAGKVIESIRTVFKKGVQERVPLNMNQLIQSVLVRARGEVLLHGVSVQTELDAQLPLVTGDVVQLQQVVLNLVTNAVDAMSAVIDRPRVLRLKSSLHEFGNVLVSVEDTGTGPDPKHWDRIFEAFFTTKSDGMGMGLLICRSIIEAHGGRLWATSNGAQGAIFHFTLPANESGIPSTAGLVQ